MDDLRYGIAFDIEDSGTVFVYPRCHCGRYLKHGQLFINGLDMVTLKGWLCKAHGEVTPDYEFVDRNDLVRANDL